MEILLVESDPLIRDHVKVGLQQFPDINVTVGVGYRGINELRSQSFDCLFLGIDPRDQESTGLLSHLRSFNNTVEVVVLTQPRHAKDMAKEKGKYDIHSLLATPIDPKDLFDFVGRFLERHGVSTNSQRRMHKPTPRNSSGMPDLA